jgi:DNA topoisomerase-2
MKKAAERYQKLTHREHVLQRPETYIGSTLTEKKSLYVVENLEEIKFIKKELDFNPGFLKLFDEVIVNASDHYIRTEGQVKKIIIQVENDNISIMNDGPGIPIEMHEKEKMYIPELIFGNLLTGENFDDTEERMVGGRNGFGSKLTNIYSKKFILDCADGTNRFQQTFYNNLSRKSTPKITKSKKSYTKITYFPDFERFGLEEINEDIKSIFLKRSVDVAVYCPKVKVYFNDTLIPMKNFKDYIQMYINEEEYFTETINENWEIGVCKSSDDQFEQISMVNGIFTYEGGTHVNYITNQITKKISEALTKKYKGKVNITDIERNLFVFVNCKIANPSFTSQTKEKLITKILRNSEISDNFIKKIMNSEIVESIINYIEAKEAAKLRTQSAGKKSKIKIKKLDDANKAGSKDSSKCLLFLTEGDCLQEDTKISIIRNGFKIETEIKNVKIGDVVITHKNNIGIINQISKKIKKCVKIKLKNGEFLICSKEHKWYIYDKVDKIFKFIETSKLDLKKHRFVFNKNSNIENFLEINKIEKINDKKYNYILYVENEKIYSSSSHKFSVFNHNKQKIEMVECKNIDIKNHSLITYKKL